MPPWNEEKLVNPDKSFTLHADSSIIIGHAFKRQNLVARWHPSFLLTTLLLVLDTRILVLHRTTIQAQRINDTPSPERAQLEKLTPSLHTYEVLF